MWQQRRYRYEPQTVCAQQFRVKGNINYCMRREATYRYHLAIQWRHGRIVRNHTTPYTSYKLQLELRFKSTLWIRFSFRICYFGFGSAFNEADSKLRSSCSTSSRQVGLIPRFENSQGCPVFAEKCCFSYPGLWDCKVIVYPQEK